ncbi:MAG TPA: hypothetical protein VI583_05340 [Cyclobacteriaceae bacterium]|nr:hypothetical protein [Cyclobacteriaceae bacterium]
MEQQFSISVWLKFIIVILIIIGITTIGLGFYYESDRTWANFLLNNYLFLSLAIGATFFLALQYITQSGWSALFIRIPHAIGMYIPVAAILILILIFGMHSIYDWSIPEIRVTDPVIKHKSPYLNIPFFFIRLVIFFLLWIILTRLLRRTSLKEDHEAGLKYFIKSEFYSKIYIFIIAITFSIATFDLIMSIDVHWYSTIFAAKNFVSGLNHSVAIITLIVIFLNSKGCLNNLNKNHLHDFSRYIFILSTIWAYLWFVEYLIIWFTNIPEETIYYVVRTGEEWKVFFFLNIFLNWVIPFIALFSNKLDNKKPIILIVCVVMIIGQWIDLYLQIMPGTTGKYYTGIIEIGTFAGFAGVFILTIAITLTKIPLIPQNHPFLLESIHHQS